MQNKSSLNLVDDINRNLSASLGIIEILFNASSSHIGEGKQGKHCPAVYNLLLDQLEEVKDMNSELWDRVRESQTVGD